MISGVVGLGVRPFLTASLIEKLARDKGQQTAELRQVHGR